jgi:hypothetical protein
MMKVGELQRLMMTVELEHWSSFAKSSEFSTWLLLEFLFLTFNLSHFGEFFSFCYKKHVYLQL